MGSNEDRRPNPHRGRRMINWGPLLEKPLVGSEAPKEPHQTPKCLGCGRFCRSRSRQYYDGNWDQLEYTTICARCGEISEDMV